MNKLTQQDAFEAKVRTMAEGFRSMREQGTQLVFRGESMVPMQAAQRLQLVLDGYQAARDADAGRQTAIEALEKAMDDHHAFYEASVTVVKAHFGSDTRRLAAFGLGDEHKVSRRRRAPARGRREACPEPSRGVVRTTVLEETIVDRGPGREVIETEEVVETTVPERHHERPHREPRKRTATAPVAPFTGTSPLPPAPAPTTTKSKAGARR